MKSFRLILSNGSQFEGEAPEWQTGSSFGEVVFNTGMTGYFESLTDPSYAGQILVFTYPLIGNYGVPDPIHWESKKIQVRGVVVSESCFRWSHHMGLKSLWDWLEEERIPLLTGVDTRGITKLLRSSGTLLGMLTDEKTNTLHFEDPNQDNLVSQVSPKSQEIIGKGKKRIIAVDCGMKESMMKELLRNELQIKRVSFDYDYSEEEFDGVFLSNGPGDPSVCIETIRILQKAMKREKPIFGVCLGSQMMALAAGAKTYKLPFGHRGHNQPCMHLESKRCFITSQNHGFAVDETTLPDEWMVTFRNLNDNSVEGISHRRLPFFSVQFHPEACPGPLDTRWLFERFIQCL